MRHAQSLCEFLADLGGLRVMRGNLVTVGSGELRAIGADKWHRVVAAISAGPRYRQRGFNTKRQNGNES